MINASFPLKLVESMRCCPDPAEGVKYHMVCSLYFIFRPQNSNSETYLPQEFCGRNRGHALLLSEAELIFHLFGQAEVMGGAQTVLKAKPIGFAGAWMWGMGEREETRKAPKNLASATKRMECH